MNIYDVYIIQEIPKDFDIKEKLDNDLNNSGFCEKRARKIDIDEFIE